MEIEYPEKSAYTDKVSVVTLSIEDFLYEKILKEETWSGGTRTVRLEDQPQVVCKALGRLVNRLLEKNILDLEDLHWIAGTQWDRISDIAKLKAQPNEQ